MSELADDLFYEDAEPPPKKKKRGPLFWILGGCGCGCFGIVLMLGISSFVFFRAYENGQKDEVKWPALQEVLSFEERPEEIDVQMYFELFDYGQFHLAHRQLGLDAVLNVYESAREAEALFNPDMPGGFSSFDPDDVKTVDVQGREVRYVVFDNMPDLSRIPEFMQKWVELPDPETAGFTLRADLSDDRRGLVLDLGRSLRGASLEPPTADDLVAFLEPFDVWNER